MTDLLNLFMGEPAGPSQNVRFRQGIILTWNAVTLENTILVGNTPMVNLPVLGVGEIDVYSPGDVVGLLVIESSDGTGAVTYAIIGQLVIPGTQAATDAINAALSSRVLSDFVYPSGESTGSTTYTDLATVGPRVTVPVGPSGRILIIATAQIQWIAGTAATTLHGGRFDVEFLGANVRTPVEATDPLVGTYTLLLTTSAGTNTPVNTVSVTTQAVFEGLNPGDTQITMKYRAVVGVSANPDFHRRGMTVFKL